MTDVASETGRGRPIRKSRNGAAPHAIALAKRLGLRYVTTDALSIRRRRSGKGWAYIGSNGRPIRYFEAPSGGSLAWWFRRPIGTCSTPPTRPHIFRPSGATPPAGCNTVTIRSGKTCARAAKRAGSP